MNRNLGLGAAVLSLTAASIVTLSAPAQAASYDQVECYNSGNASGYSILCDLSVTDGASNQAWTYDGYAVPSAAGRNVMRHSCAPNGHVYTVTVTYVEDSGVTSTATTTNVCGGINQ